MKADINDDHAIYQKWLRKKLLADPDLVAECKAYIEKVESEK